MHNLPRLGYIYFMAETTVGDPRMVSQEFMNAMEKRNKDAFRGEQLHETAGRIVGAVKRISSGAQSLFKRKGNPGSR